jgi:hypothetical protein
LESSPVALFLFLLLLLLLLLLLNNTLKSTQESTLSRKHPEKHSEKHPDEHSGKHPGKRPEKMPPATPTPDPTPFVGLIQHHPDHRLLYCGPCWAVVFIVGLLRHLQTYHLQLPLNWRKRIHIHYQFLDLITQKMDLKLLPNHSPALPFLPITGGYSCMQDD